MKTLALSIVSTLILTTSAAAQVAPQILSMFVDETAGELFVIGRTLPTGAGTRVFYGEAELGVLELSPNLLRAQLPASLPNGDYRLVIVGGGSFARFDATLARGINPATGGGLSLLADMAGGLGLNGEIEITMPGFFHATIRCGTSQMVFEILNLSSEALDTTTTRNDIIGVEKQVLGQGQGRGFGTQQPTVFSEVTLQHPAGGIAHIFFRGEVVSTSNCDAVLTATSTASGMIPK